MLTHAENGDLNEIKLLLNNNQSSELTNYTDNDGYTALHRASYSNHLHIVKYLIDTCHMSIEVRTKMGWTPLHSASYWNNYEIVEYLLVEKNANINAQTDGGQTPLHLAASQKHCKETIILLLTNSFINTNLINNSGETATQVATRSCEHYRLFEIADSNLNILKI